MRKERFPSEPFPTELREKLLEELPPALRSLLSAGRAVIMLVPQGCPDAVAAEVVAEQVIDLFPPMAIYPLISLLLTHLAGGDGPELIARLPALEPVVQQMSSRFEALELTIQDILLCLTYWVRDLEQELAVLLAEAEAKDAVKN